MHEKEDFVLGEDIAELAKADEKKGMVVVSVRLSAKEVARLDTLSHATGKTISQLIRDAIRNMRMPSQPVITFSISNSPGSVSYGTIGEETVAPSSDQEGLILRS